MQKRGQVTIFILVGIFILLFIGFFFFYTAQEQPPVSEEAPAVASVRVYVESCLEQTTEEAIFTLGLSGGYYTVPEPKTDALLIATVPYFLYNGETYIISIDEIADNIEDYLSAQLNYCLEGLSDIPAFNGEYYMEEIAVKFQDQKISIDLVMPVTIIAGEKQTTLENFHSEISTSLSTVLSLSHDIIEKAKESDGYFPITYSSMLVAEKGYNLEYTTVEDAMIVSIIDTNTVYDEHPLLFTFALSIPTKYERDAVQIEEIEPQSAIVYYPFSLVVHAIGENLSFSDSTDMFEIDEKTGLINFTPTKKDQGNHSIIIKVENALWLDIEILNINIEPLLQNNPPVLNKIHSLYGRVGKLLYYKINATDPENDSIIFISSDPIFKINQITGEINVTLTEPYETRFNITIIDRYGNTDVEEVYARVRE